jgi:exodeoxyribonuclease-3
MRLATWNVNSIRTRIDRVIAFLDRSHTDVLALQETKCRPDQFPVEAFEAAGYRVAAHGLDQWNGVAIASRVGLSDIETAFTGQPSFGKPGQEPILEARAIGATCGGVRVWSVYVPNGRALDDPHFPYKLAFLAALKDAAGAWAAGDTPVVIVGDWNVAPLDSDIWDPSEPEVATHVSPDVRRAFFALEEAGYEEISRRFIPEEGRYTYWDYQRLRFPKGEGMRIDHVYASPSLAARATGVAIDREERKGVGASDHVPVTVDFLDDPGSVIP